MSTVRQWATARSFGARKVFFEGGGDSGESRRRLGAPEKRENEDGDGDDEGNAFDGRWFETIEGIADALEDPGEGVAKNAVAERKENHKGKHDESSGNNDRHGTAGACGAGGQRCRGRLDGLGDRIGMADRLERAQRGGKDFCNAFEKRSDERELVERKKSRSRVGSEQDRDQQSGGGWSENGLRNRGEYHGQRAVQAARRMARWRDWRD